MGIASVAVATDDMTRESLAAALQSQLSAIDSIDVVFDHEYAFSDSMSDLRQRLAGRGVLHDGALQARREEWAEQGSCLLHKRLRPPTDKSQSTLMAFDGEKGYFYRWDSPSGDADGLDVTREIASSYWQNPCPAYAIGRRVPLCRESLVDLIRLPTAAVRGLETLHGSDCYRVDVNGFESLRKQPLKLSAHLDPTHDFLPARISVAYDSADLPQNVSFVWEVEEFMRVRDAADASEHWFPRVARETDGAGARTLRVVSVRINEKLPVDHFRPKPSEGTVIADAFDPEGRHVYILGGAKAEEAAVARAAEIVKQEIAKSSVPEKEIDARPIQQKPWAFLLLIISLGLCAIAVLLWTRRQ